MLDLRPEDYERYLEVRKVKEQQEIAKDKERLENYDNRRAAEYTKTRSCLIYKFFATDKYLLEIDNDPND